MEFPAYKQNIDICSSITYTYKTHTDRALNSYFMIMIMTIIIAIVS